MKILLTAATEMELSAIRSNTDCQHHVSELISGVGSMTSCFQLHHKILDINPDWVIQIGIAGSFTPLLPPGSTVGVLHEFLGDLGVEENNIFKDVFDMGFLKPNQSPFSQKSLFNPHWSNLQTYDLPLVKSVTVNEITTRKVRIDSLIQSFNPDIESMEGAALHYTCLLLNKPFLQIRAVSNEVGERNKDKWKISNALANLAITTNKILNSIP